MNEELPVEENTNEPFYKKYKIHLSVAAAILVVGVTALTHYKNEQVKEELVKAINEYQEGLVLIGGEMSYKSIDCGGIITTDCEIETIKFSIMGQEQLSIGSLRLGNIEELSEFKAFGKGGAVKASVDIEADEVALPKAMIAQLIAQNVSNAFQQNTLGKLSSINLALKGEVEGNAMNIKHLEVDSFRIDNAIMPLEFSMSARDVSSQAPDSMILEEFSLTLENRAISDVTYESVKSFTDTLQKEDKAIFLKEFALTPADMNDRKKASSAINAAIAKRFESDLPNTPGVVEKDLIRAMIQMLKGEIEEITLEGKNKNNLTMVQIQNALQQSSAMKDIEARKFMEDKFKIEVEAD
ncbi:hypothetical protein [Sulfuricurvum sp.]|uniref:hypothetical protein n=1 Tax=Sulfuricurvum sp. TaxID=2025608 RepID=UPI00286DAF5F|nr:hypothetical protein [Sulfuricurvum sp.]